MTFKQAYKQIDDLEGWMGSEDCEALYKEASKVKNGLIVEIGCFMGRSTKIMALASPTSEIVSIDPLTSVHNSLGHLTPDEVYTRLHKAMEGFNWTHIRRKSQDVKWDKPIDLLFIDGDHHAKPLKRDIELFVPHANKVMFHDYVINGAEEDGGMVKHVVENSSYLLDIEYPAGFALCTTIKLLIDHILSISKKHKLSHIGSCVSALPVIYHIYKNKKPDEPFILSCGHSFIAQAVVMEHFGLGDAEKMFKHHGTHPDRCKECGIDYSTGSLGHGIGAAVGMALSDRKRKVHCLISDGECMEGSVWEALRIKTQLELDNLEVHVNANGYTALDVVDIPLLTKRLEAFCPDIVIHKTNNGDFGGVAGHYTIL